tara:strand:+ start:191 stop:502 length:312 start_codon:yes stop_codon:yes gene_type:complete
MIDTDKYEGHTEGPWSVSDELGIIVIKHGQGLHDFVGMDNEANAQLMADAPLLLEEVKRWRGNWTYLRDWLVKSINNEKTNLTARAFSEMFLQLMDGRDEVSE